MKGKRKLGVLFISSFLVTILIAGFIQCASMAAATKSPDLNGDKAVNIADVMLVASAFNTTSADPSFKTAYDLNSDNAINIADVMVIAGLFNTTITSTNTPVPSATAQPTKDYNTDLTGDIVFSVPSKVFQGQISVTLSTTIANAQIRYTTNGSVPTNSSTLYSGTLTFTKTTQLRTQAFVNGTKSGKMGTAIYVATSINPQHDVPVIIIDDYGAGKLVKDTDKDCAIMVLDTNDNNQLSLLQTPDIATRGAIHIRGQSSANFEKAPYKIELRGNDDNDAKYKVLGLGHDGDWCLLSPYPDKSLIRDPLAYTLGEDMGLMAPGWRFVEVYLNTNNQPLSADDYQGVYWLVEKLEIQDNRVDIAKLKPGDSTEPNISGGYLMQFNMQCAEAPLIKGSGWNDLELTEPSDATSQQITWITNYIQKVQNAIHSSNPSDPTTGYPAYIDVDSFVNYIIANELAREADAYMRSTRIYKDRSKKLCAGPLWDYDLGYDSYTGMGGFGGTTSTIEGWQFQPMFGGFGGTTCDWFNTLMQDPSFQSKISARWQELRKGPLSDANMIARVKSLSAPLTNAAKRNFQKWNILNTSQVGGFGTQTTQTWEQQLTILQNFLTKRAAWLDSSGWKPTTNPTSPWGF